MTSLPSWDTGVAVDGPSGKPLPDWDTGVSVDHVDNPPVPEITITDPYEWGQAVGESKRAYELSTQTGLPLPVADVMRALLEYKPADQWSYTDEDYLRRRPLPEQQMVEGFMSTVNPVDDVERAAAVARQPEMRQPTLGELRLPPLDMSTNTRFANETTGYMVEESLRATGIVEGAVALGRNTFAALGYGDKYQPGDMQRAALLTDYRINHPQDFDTFISIMGPRVFGDVLIANGTTPAMDLAHQIGAMWLFNKALSGPVQGALETGGGPWVKKTLGEGAVLGGAQTLSLLAQGVPHAEALKSGLDNMVGYLALMGALKTAGVGARALTRDRYVNAAKADLTARLGLPPDAGFEQIQRAVSRALDPEAKAVFDKAAGLTAEKPVEDPGLKTPPGPAADVALTETGNQVEPSTQGPTSTEEGAGVVDVGGGKPEPVPTPAAEATPTSTTILEKFPNATFHSTTDPESLNSILTTGLRPGTHVSDVSGQGTEGPITLVYAQKPRGVEKSYRPGETITSSRLNKPIAILYDTGEFVPRQSTEVVLAQLEAWGKSHGNMSIEDIYAAARDYQTSPSGPEKGKAGRAFRAAYGDTKALGLLQDLYVAQDREIAWDEAEAAGKKVDRRSIDDIVLDSAKKAGVPVYEVTFDEASDIKKLTGKVLFQPETPKPTPTPTQTPRPKRVETEASITASETAGLNRHLRSAQKLNGDKALPPERVAEIKAEHDTRLQKRLDKFRAGGGAQKGFVGIPSVTDLVKPFKVAVDALTQATTWVARGGKSGHFAVDPAWVTRRAVGDDPTVNVYRGTRGIPDVEKYLFDQQYLKSLDQTADQLREHLNSHYTPDEQQAFRLATRGHAVSPEAKAIVEAAKARVPEPLWALPGLKDAMSQMYDYNYERVKPVFKTMWDQAQVGLGPERQLEFQDWLDKEPPGYVEDYVNGLYVDGRTTVKNFITNVIPTTDSFTKHKIIPSEADALAAGLKTRYPGIVDQARGELGLIVRLQGALWEREVAYRYGRGTVVLPDTIPNRMAHPDWVKLTDHVFKDDLWEPDYAMMHNNIVSFNKVLNDPVLASFRTMANVSRYTKLWLPFFHQGNVEKTALKELALLSSEAGKTARSTTHLSVKLGRNPFREPTNPDYLHFIELGGTHITSGESEAMHQISAQLNQAARFVTGSDTLVDKLSKANVLRRYREWLFDDHIPNLKFASYQCKVALAEAQLGRPLTQVEEQNLVKLSQNLYGEMNDAIAGRSGTATSVMRLMYMAPGWAEGNARLIEDSALNWTGVDTTRGRYARRFIPFSYATAVIAASLGTRVMTGKWPLAPKNAGELRDLTKIDTGVVNDQGQHVLVDLLTYERDYNILYGNLAGAALETAHGRSPLPSLTNIPAEVFARQQSMTGGFARTVGDLIDITQGKALYDYADHRVMPVYDTTLQKALKLIIHEMSQSEPIALSTAQTAKRQGLKLGVVAVESLLGFRPTLSEADKAQNQVLRQWYALRNDGTRMMRLIAEDQEGLTNHYQQYVDNANRIIDLFSPEKQPQYRAEFKLDQIRALREVIISEALSKHSAQDKHDAIQRVVSKWH
jgi:hypothetical protein